MNLAFLYYEDDILEYMPLIKFVSLSITYNLSLVRSLYYKFDF